VSKLNEEFMSQIRPLKFSNLIRVGSDFDGGYVLPEQSTKNIEILYSYGYGYNFEFEEHFASISGCRVLLFSNEANFHNLIWKFINSTLFRLFSHSKEYAPRKHLKDFLNYLKLIQSDSITYINAEVTGNHASPKKSKSISFDSTIEDFHTNFMNSGMKIDIEGGEYDCLENSMISFSNFSFVLIEFHSVPKNIEKFKEILERFSKTFVIGNLHINNYGSIADNGIPEIIELTFVNKLHVQCYEHVDFIPSLLDRVCCVRLPEIEYIYQ